MTYPYKREWAELARQGYGGSFSDYLDERFAVYLSWHTRDGLTPMMRTTWDIYQKMAEDADAQTVETILRNKNQTRMLVDGA
jgi:hypothetical protein